MEISRVGSPVGRTKPQVSVPHLPKHKQLPPLLAWRHLRNIGRHWRKCELISVGSYVCGHECGAAISVGWRCMCARIPSCLA